MYWLVNMLVVLLLASFWHRDPIHILYCFNHSHWCTNYPFDAVTCTLLQHLIMFENTWLCSPFAPEIARLSLFCWSVNCNMFFVSVFCWSWHKKSWAQITQSSHKIAKVTCSLWAICHLSPLMTPWPGKNESLGEVRTSLNSSSLSSAGCSGFADRLLPLLSLLAFPVAPCLCSGRCWARACSSSWWSLLSLYQEWPHKLNRHVPIEEGCLKATPTGGH